MANAAPAIGRARAELARDVVAALERQPNVQDLIALLG